VRPRCPSARSKCRSRPESTAPTTTTSRRPATDLLGVATGQAADLGVYEYPAGQDSKDGVEAAVDRRLQAFEVQGRLVRGGSTNALVAPGSTVTLQDHPRAELQHRPTSC
jgi:uncharacterized protein involved in type VI secretion and phage assembly